MNDCWYSQLSSTLTPVLGVVARAVHLAREKKKAEAEADEIMFLE